MTPTNVLGSKLTLSWMKASCVDSDMTKASERPATDFFGSTVARKKLHDSGQNCADDIFLFWISEGRICPPWPGKDTLPLAIRRVMSTPGTHAQERCL